MLPGAREVMGLATKGDIRQVRDTVARKSQHLESVERTANSTEAKLEALIKSLYSPLEWDEIRPSRGIYDLMFYRRFPKTPDPSIKHRLSAIEGVATNQAEEAEVQRLATNALRPENV
jgi:hypothetical protein